MPSTLARRMATCMHLMQRVENDSGVTMLAGPLPLHRKLLMVLSMWVLPQHLPPIQPVALPIPLHHKVRLPRFRLQMGRSSGNIPWINMQAQRLPSPSMSSMWELAVTSFTHSAQRMERKSGVTRIAPQGCFPTTHRLRLRLNPNLSCTAEGAEFPQ